MNSRFAIALAGCATLGLGVFAPVIRAPIVGTRNYFSNGEGDGAVILLLALASLILSLQSRYEWLWTTGLGSLSLLILTFVRFRQNLDEMRANAARDRSDNPFRGLADAALASVQIEWGWAVLTVGAFLLLVAAGLREPVRRRCAHCAELIQPAAILCRHCGRDAPAIEVPPEVPPRLPRRVAITTLLLVGVIVALVWLAPWIRFVVDMARS